MSARCLALGAAGTATSDTVCTQCAAMWHGDQCQLAEVALTVKYVRVSVYVCGGNCGPYTVKCVRAIYAFVSVVPDCEVCMLE